MRDVNESNYIEITRSFLVEEEILLKATGLINNTLAQLRVAERKQSQVDREFQLVDYILKKLGEIKPEKKIGLLGGGGTDSTFLLSCLHQLDRQPDVYSIETAANYSALSQLEKICSHFDIRHRKIRMTDELIDAHVSNFQVSINRLPRDPVVPAVMEIASRALADGLDVLIDGQFADTVSFSNPQNTLLSKTISSLRNSKNLLNVNRLHGRSKPLQFSQYILLSLPDKILFLSRVEITPQTTMIVQKFLEKNEPNAVLQSLFWHCTLVNRERDKYLCNKVEIFCPFDSEDLLRRFYLCRTNIKKIMREEIFNVFGLKVSKSSSSSFRLK